MQDWLTLARRPPLVFGAGGLGVFIFRGIASVDKLQILAGAVPSALLALGADAALGWLEKRCTVR